MKLLVMLMLIASILFSCSSMGTVGGGKSAKKSKSSSGKVSQKDGKNNVSSADESKPIFKRFSDTTFIYLGEYIVPKNDNKETSTISTELERAIEQFESGETAKACQEISKILTNLSKDSEDYPEAFFYASECYIAKNKFEPSKKILLELLGRKDVDDPLMERLYVRLGQIYCVEGDKDEAMKYFKRLKIEYPKSQYISVANCSVVEK